MQWYVSMFIYYFSLKVIIKSFLCKIRKQINKRTKPDKIFTVLLYVLTGTIVLKEEVHLSENIETKRVDIIYYFMCQILIKRI